MYGYFLCHINLELLAYSQVDTHVTDPAALPIKIFAMCSEIS